MILIDAIARMEGWFALGENKNRPQRNNNPGNLRYGKFSVKHGAIGNDNGYAIFPNADTGFAALRALLSLDEYSSLTLGDAISKYAPMSENNTQEYVNLVCKWTGFSSTDLVSKCLNG